MREEEKERGRGEGKRMKRGPGVKLISYAGVREAGEENAAQGLEWWWGAGCAHQNDSVVASICCDM